MVKANVVFIERIGDDIRQHEWRANLGEDAGIAQHFAIRAGDGLEALGHRQERNREVAFQIQIIVGGESARRL